MFGQEKKKVVCFMEHPYLLVVVLILLFFFGGLSCADGPVSKHVVGGQCEYKEYRGEAEIILIQKKELLNNYGKPSYEGYEVKFSFHNHEVIEEPHGQVEGKQYLLLLDNSSYPGPKFLQKYGIEVGERFDCNLKVIVRGTCTPVLFDFQTIDLGDDFENKN